MKPALILLAAMLATVLAAIPAAAADAAAKPALVVTMLDGKTFDLSKQNGKWVIVNFWATWCSPCLKELPDISQFVEAHKDDVSAIGLAYEDSDKADIENFLKLHPISYPVAQVDVYDPPKAFETPRGLPTTYLIAPDGRIAKHFTGPITGKDLDETISAGGKSGG